MKVAAFHASRVLDDTDLGPVLDACTWCGGDQLIPVAPVQRQPLVELRRCGTCDAAGVSRLPTAEALDDYYGSYYEGDRDHAVTMDDPGRLARRIASYLTPSAGSLTVLDLGGGDGTIGARVLAELGTAGAITVVDYDHSRTAPTPDGVTIAHATELADLPPDSHYDLVLASAVLEHIPQPAPVLADLLRRVAPGGTFYARVPYVGPFLTVGQRLRVDIDFTFPAHLYDLGPRFWAGLAGWVPGADRFEVLASRPSPVETGFRQRPGRTAIATLAKAPWSVLSTWPFVGGWEHVLRAGTDPAPDGTAG